MKHFSLLFSLFLLLTTSPLCQAEARLKQSDALPGYVPKDGFVPDGRTVIAIAVAVLVPIYGEEEIRSKSPFVAVLQDGKWTVTGTLGKNLVGGVPEVRLLKATGAILKVSSGK